jgi:DNA-binding LacI/PurR family transcriptional regulator
MGKLAAQLLIEQIEQGAAPKHVVLQPRLLVGETT